MLLFKDYEKSFIEFNKLMNESKGKPTPQSNFIVQNELAKISGFVRFSRQHARCKDNATLDILDEGINQKNKEIKKDFIEDDINDNIASNSGFITFEDKTVGFYIDCIEMTHYYEIEHLFKNLKRTNQKDNLHVVILSSKSTQTQSKMEKEKEEYDLTDEQKFYNIVNIILMLQKNNYLMQLLRPYAMKCRIRQ
jgi:hypothetical protein